MSFPDIASIEDSLDDASLDRPGRSSEVPPKVVSPTGIAEVTFEPPKPNPAMKKLLDNAELHFKVLNYMKERIRFSEEIMHRFYWRWAANEMRIQAFAYHPKNEDYLKALNESGELPNAVRIVVPFGHAALNTISTFLLHTFTQHDPIFQVGSYKDEASLPAQNMQTLIDFQADYSGLVQILWQFFNDICYYGFGAIQNDWDIVEKMRTIRQMDGVAPTSGFASGPSFEHSRRLVTVYEGNKASPIDPFLFFPDPRVPMAECNRRGEFAFWRNYESYYTLKEMELAGAFFQATRAVSTLPNNTGDNSSSRANLARGIAIPGSSLGSDHVGYKGRSYRQVDQGTIRIIPKELGIGNSEVPELWMTALVNKDRVVQLEKFDSDHGMHPISVSEPTGSGYSFGSPGPADYIGPLQDMMGWLFNSHIDNVRSFLNNAVVVDPSKIVMKDLRDRQNGQIIRLKATAIGSDVRTAVHQLQLNDVTRQNITDAQALMDLGYMLLAVNEATMGNPQASSRETATGVRARAAAATNRLGAMSKIISAQAMRPLTEQWVDNTQQYMSDEFYEQIVGLRGIGQLENPFREDVSGAWTFPIHDGTMPLDPVTQSQIWKTILEAGAQLPGFGQRYDVYGIFEKAAMLGGAKEIKSFRLGSGGPVAAPTQTELPGPESGLGQLMGQVIGAPDGQG